MAQNEMSYCYKILFKSTLICVEKIMTIDPGILASGWAFFPRIRRNSAPVNFSCGVVRAHKGLWQEKASTIVKRLSHYLEFHKPTFVVCEFPSFWGQSATSHASTAKGSLFKLSYLVGRIEEHCAKIGIRHVACITPQEWKGQLPKEVVQSRLIEHYGRRFRDHEADAVGIGLAIAKMLP